MNFPIKVFTGAAVFFLLSLPQGLYAQRGKAALAARKALSSAAVDRNILSAAKRPDIRLSVARLDHSILMDLPRQKRPHSTAFLFRTYYKGRPEVWAATAGHVAQPGERIILTFYNKKKEIPVTGTLVQKGPELLSDAALIKINTPLPPDLQPFTLAEQLQTQEPLTTWGYASNKLYHMDNLTFEKDNTRFIRTDFPEEQKKRSGLCGGPLLNAQGEVMGIHCGTSLEDKAYAANINIIPYLLEAYYEGTSQIPVVAKQVVFGSIDINERILDILCIDENGKMINHEAVYGQLPQSLIMTLYKDAEVRRIKFVLGSSRDGKDFYRMLVYDKKTQEHWFEPL